MHIEYLRSLGACDRGIRYASRFPTLADAYAACESLADLKWLLKATHWATYRAACAPHLDTYLAACAPHLATYHAARAPHRAAYLAAIAPHEAAYLAAIAPHLATYLAACDAIDACNTCDEVRAQFSCPEVSK